MEELEMKDCIASMAIIRSALNQLPCSTATEAAMENLEAMVLELAAWKTLKEPQVLHVNLLRGFPAKLSKASLLHLVGAPECSNAGCCKQTNPLG